MEKESAIVRAAKCWVYINEKGMSLRKACKEADIDDKGYKRYLPEFKKISKDRIKEISEGRNIEIKLEIEKDIINHKKISKDIKTPIIQTPHVTKKKGRPRKEPGTKKVKLNLLIEPKYLVVLKQEAKEAESDLSPYITSNYIIKHLKDKYEELK